MSVVDPADFDAFWESTLDDTRRRRWEPRIAAVPGVLDGAVVHDAVFSGFDGAPIRGWFRRPRDAEDRLPVVVRFTGYGAGRGGPADDPAWTRAGFAELVMDTRGQGDGGTRDGHHHGAGFLTRGIAHPETYYYRRVFADAAMAVAAARRMPGVDPARVATVGNSQGGGIAIAAAVLEGGADLVLAQSPFLADIAGARAAGATGPWAELDELERRDAISPRRVAETLSYVDVVNFARRARTPVALSCGLADDIVPASTTIAVHDAWSAERRIRTWPGAGHEAGGDEDLACALALLDRAWRPETASASGRRHG